jgi:outer membrane protein assembly factor BamB
MVFIGSCNGMFRALDRRTGEVRWATKAGPQSIQYFFHGDPLITDTLVVVGADGGGAAGVVGKVHAFDRTSGAERWTYPAGSGVRGPMSGDRRSAFAIKADKELVALDLESGAVRWSYPLDVWGWMGPVAGGGRVMAGGRDGSVYALNADTGRVEWRTELGAPVSTDVAATATGLYAGTGDGVMHRLDAARGSVVASLKLDGKLKPRSVPVLAGDSLLVLLTNEGDDYRALVSLDPTLSRIRWRQDAATQWNTSRVFVWGGAAVVGTSAGDVIAYCTSDGAKAWSRTVKGPVRSIGGSADALYVTTSDGNLYALGLVSACNTR